MFLIYVGYRITSMLFGICLQCYFVFGFMLDTFMFAVLFGLTLDIEWVNGLMYVCSVILRIWGLYA